MEYAQEELNYTDSRSISLNKNNRASGIDDISILSVEKLHLEIQ